MRRFALRSLLWLCFLWICAVAAQAVRAAPSPWPRTVVGARGPITAFAQDGRYLAWADIEPGTRACAILVRVRDLRRGFQNAVSRRGGETCGSDLPVTRLALAGGRALWFRYEAGNNEYFYLETAGLASPPERRVADL